MTTGLPKQAKSRRDDGFALVAAVAGVAVFAFFAFEILDASRGPVALLHAQQDRAVLAAAADAGIAQAIYNLALDDRAKRLPVDGIPRPSSFDNVRLSITVSDERGKVPINRVGSDVERRLFAAAGVNGDRLDILVDSLDDWKDENDAPRSHGAEIGYYRPLGIRPRNGAIRTVDELGQIRGMDAALLARIAPAITVFPGNDGGFNADTAAPLALAAMQGEASAGFNIQKRQQELVGQRTALDITADTPIAGRSLSILVNARLSDGSVYTREEIVEFTGNPGQPYWIRYVR